MSTKYSDDLAGIVPVSSMRIPPSTRLGGRVHVITDSFETVAGAWDSAISDYVALAAVKSSDVILEIELATDALVATTLTANIGVYQLRATEVDLGASGMIVDADLFASAADILSITPWTSYRYEAANIDTCGKAIWEMLGLTNDPCVAYILGIDLASTVGAAAGGTLAYRITYTDG